VYCAGICGLCISYRTHRFRRSLLGRLDRLLALGPGLRGTVRILRRGLLLLRKERALNMRLNAALLDHGLANEVRQLLVAAYGQADVAGLDQAPAG
jgi:hypothetical protein